MRRNTINEHISLFPLYNAVPPWYNYLPTNQNRRNFAPSNKRKVSEFSSQAQDSAHLQLATTPKPIT